MSKDIIAVIKDIEKKLKKCRKMLFCANGGSAADAQNLSAEFIARLSPNINRYPRPAITLVQDASTLTACGNDCSFDDIFLTPPQALFKKEDILICISTSANSKNILKVLKEAKKKFYSVSFLGKWVVKQKRCAINPLRFLQIILVEFKSVIFFLGHFILEKVEDQLVKKIKT